MGWIGRPGVRQSVARDVFVVVRRFDLTIETKRASTRSYLHTQKATAKALQTLLVPHRPEFRDPSWPGADPQPCR